MCVLQLLGCFTKTQRIAHIKKFHNSQEASILRNTLNVAFPSIGIKIKENSNLHSGVGFVSEHFDATYADV